MSKTGNLEKHKSNRQDNKNRSLARTNTYEATREKLHPYFSYAYFRIIIDMQCKGRKKKKKSKIPVRRIQISSCPVETSWTSSLNAQN